MGVKPEIKPLFGHRGPVKSTISCDLSTVLKMFEFCKMFRITSNICNTVKFFKFSMAGFRRYDLSSWPILFNFSEVTVLVSKRSDTSERL